MTLYAFSTENWKRPKSEVSFLMDLPSKFFDTFVPELIENNVKVNVMGYTDQLPEKTQKAVFDAIEQTKNFELCLELRWQSRDRDRRQKNCREGSK